MRVRRMTTRVEILSKISMLIPDLRVFASMMIRMEVVPKPFVICYVPCVRKGMSVALQNILGVMLVVGL